MPTDAVYVLFSSVSWLLTAVFRLLILLPLIRWVQLMLKLVAEVVRELLWLLGANSNPFGTYKCSLSCTRHTFIKTLKEYIRPHGFRIRVPLTKKPNGREEAPRDL